MASQAPSQAYILALKKAIDEEKLKYGSPSASRLARQFNVPRPTMQTQIDAIRSGRWEHTVEKINDKAKDELVSLKVELASVKRERDDYKRAAVDFEAIQSILGGMVEQEPAPPDWTLRPSKNLKSAEVPVTFWSDWHAGEVVSRQETNGINEFNSRILEQRVRRLVETTIDLCKNHGPGNYPGIVINLGGDFISGGIHPELAKTDDATSIQSALHVRDLLIWALGQMADAFGKLFVPCVAGNHGRNTHKPEFKNTVYQNFDWLIYQMLARHFQGDKRIVFLIPASNEAHYQVYGVRYLAMHGDTLGVKGGDGIIGSLGPISRGAMKVGKQSSAFGRDFNFLLLGHWHQMLWLPGCIVAGTLKGFDEYASRALRAPPAIPSQPLWFVHPVWGHTAMREIYLEDSKPANKAQWLSFAEATA